MITPLKTSLQGYTSRSAPGVGIHSIFGISFAFRENQGAIGLRSSCINDGVICFPVNDPRLYENITFIHSLIKFIYIFLDPSSAFIFPLFPLLGGKLPQMYLCSIVRLEGQISYSILFISFYLQRSIQTGKGTQKWTPKTMTTLAMTKLCKICVLTQMHTHTNTSLIHSHPYPPPPVRLVVTKQLMLMASAQEQWYHAFDQHSVWSWSWPTAIRTSNRHRNDTHTDKQTTCAMR